MKLSKWKCQCEICEKVMKKKLTETELHIYVGTNKSNSKAELRKFEKELLYSAVTHWDVGYTDNARYYIYLDIDGNAIAWYDAVNCWGHK